MKQSVLLITAVFTLLMFTFKTVKFSNWRVVLTPRPHWESSWLTAWGSPPSASGPPLPALSFRPSASRPQLPALRFPVGQTLLALAALSPAFALFALFLTCCVPPWIKYLDTFTVFMWHLNLLYDKEDIKVWLLGFMGPLKRVTAL